MNSAPADVRHRITAAIQRANVLDATLKEPRLDSEMRLSPGINRIAAEIRDVARELQQSFEDLAQTMAQLIQEKDAEVTAHRHAAAVFRLSPTPCLITDGSGTLIDINCVAAQLLNITPRHAVGRPFPLFLGTDRVTFLNLLSQTRCSGDVQSCDGAIRPRDRAPFAARIVIVPDASEQLLLILLPPECARMASDSSTAATDLLQSAYTLQSRRHRGAAVDEDQEMAVAGLAHGSPSKPI